MSPLSSRASLFRATALWFAALLSLCFARVSAAPAFPGAEGFGANSTGGRGGTVYHVTNLNDTGAGSFRDAVSVANRTVVFDVGGIIRITSVVQVKNNITIAGQTAPGGGITIYGNRVSFSDASNTICRYLRIREGINGDSGTDTVGIASGNNMIFDHVSASWGRDETFSVSGSAITNITLQDCIIGQGLLVHSAGGLMQTDGGVSIFRCLYTDNWMRNPKIKGVNDYQNNVVYNWGSGGGYIPAGDSAGNTFANMIGNYFIGGPNTGAGTSPFKTGNLNYRLYHSDNLEDLNLNGALDGTAVTDASFPTLLIVGAPFAYSPPVTTLTPAQALQHIINYSGASLHRDHADTYMINELLSYGTVGAQIFNESEIGGIGTVAGGLTPLDTDGDGMPDWWEQAAGTNPAVADNNGDLNGDGFTNLENYINSLAVVGVPGAFITGAVSDTGASASDGITSDTAVILNGTAAPGVTVSLYRVDDNAAIGTAVADGSGHWTFDYTGTVLTNRSYGFYATADLGGGKSSPASPLFALKVDTIAAAAPAITSIVTSPSFSFSGTAEPFAAITVTLSGGGAVGSTTADGTGAWNAAYSGAPLAPGIYTFTASAVDLAGNAGPASAPYVINTNLASPAFTSITTDSGTSASDQITNDTTIIFNGTAPAGSSVSITRIGTGVIGSAVATAGGTWSFNYTGTTLTSAQYTFSATATVAGSTSPASAPFVVTIDTVAPTIPSIVRFNPNTASTSSTTLVFRVTWIEPVLNVDTGDFVLTTAGNGMTGSITSIAPVSTSVYDVTVTGAGGDGTIRLDRKASATVVDFAGNSVSSGTFTGGQSYTMRAPGSGVWINDDSDGAWSVAANWDPTRGGIANGSSATADFSSLDITEDRTVQLDSPRTIGRLVFADSDQTSPAVWTLGDNGNPANVLTLASTGSPIIQTIYAGTTGQTNPQIAVSGEAYPTLINVALAGNQGLTKTGWGTAILGKTGPLTGPILVNEGILKVGPGVTLTSPSVALAVSSQFNVAGGTFTATGDVTMVSGTGVGFIVSDGSASFQRIIPTNARNNLVKVTGGVMTATELNFPRSADAANMFTFGLVVQGGTSTIGTVGLGTVNSWGAMSVEGGEITVPGILHVGFQQTAARGGQLRVLDGRLNSTDPVNGIVLSRKNGTNANNVAEVTLTGGVTTAEKITLGYDATVNAGTGTILLNGGALYLGSGGIVKNGTSGMTTMLTLTGGTLGAKSNWGTDQPFALPAGNTIAIKAADELDAPHDITLTGGLFGAGGITKTGAGTLILAGANTYTGTTTINAGTLRVDGSLTTGGIQINDSGTLTGTGSINVPVALNEGGALLIGGSTPDVFLGVNNLTWAGGGSLYIDLGANGASDRLVLAGALTKGVAGNYAFFLNAGAGFAAGNTYTLATFASTDFNAADFSALGLPAGFAGKFSLSGTSLQVTIVGTPFITSADTAAGTFGSAFSYAITAGNEPDRFSASGLPAGLGVDMLTGVISGTPEESGTFNVILGATNIAGTGSAPLTLSITKAASPITLGSLKQYYDGTPRLATAITDPAELNVTFTYNGEATAPTLPGTYAIIGTIDDANYQGTITGTLVVNITALVRHAPAMNGGIDGSIQVLLPESFAFNGQSFLSGDLLVPGTPKIQLNGHPTLGGTIDSIGSASPANYTVTLNGNAIVRTIVRHVDPLVMPVVSAPNAPLGTRSVNVNNSSTVIGNFATVRNLTLNGNVGQVAVPAGAYDNLTANGGSGFILGNAGATEPSVYHVQRLTINGNATLRVVGPVIIRLANGVNLNGNAGAAGAPDWLTIEISNGGLTLNGNVALSGHVVAPNGTVTINGNSVLTGTVTADRLTLNGNALLDQPAQ